MIRWPRPRSLGGGADIFTLQAFRPPGEGGWIGRWSPGIGDPTLAGWLTVALYFAAAFACFRAGRDPWRVMARREFVLYRLLAVGLVLLGINKQLDLQTALAELARMAAVEGGWYADRRRWQKAFVVAIAGVAALATAAALAVLRKTPLSTAVAAAGALGLVAFVVIRAASFHDVDNFLRARALGIRANVLIEAGSLLLVIAGATARIHGRPRRR